MDNTENIQQEPKKISKKKVSAKGCFVNSKKGDWVIIENDFIGNPKATASSLSIKYNIPPKTIGYRITKGEWIRKRQESQAAIVARLNNRDIEKKVDLAGEWNKRDLEVFTALRALGVRTINRLNEKDEKGDFIVKAINPTELRTLATLLLAAQRGGRLTLGMTTENQGAKDIDEFVLTEEEKALAKKFLDEHFS